MGPYCLPAVQSVGIAFQWGGRSGVLVTHSLYRLPSAGKFPHASERSPKGDAIYL